MVLLQECPTEIYLVLLVLFPMQESAFGCTPGFDYSKIIYLTIRLQLISVGKYIQNIKNKQIPYLKVPTTYAKI